MVFLLRILSISLVVGLASVTVFQFSSTSWPTTEAVVETGPTTERDQRLAGRNTQVLYRYEVSGTEYTGARFGFAVGTTAVGIKGAREPRQPRAGDIVTVYYQPLYPAFALLVPGPPPTLLWWSLIALLVSILLWAVSHVMREPVF